MKAAGENAIPMKRIFTPKNAIYLSDGGGPAILSNISPNDHRKNERKRAKAGRLPGLLIPALMIIIRIARPKLDARNAGQNAFGNHMKMTYASENLRLSLLRKLEGPEIIISIGFL